MTHYTLKSQQCMGGCVGQCTKLAVPAVGSSLFPPTACVDLNPHWLIDSGASYNRLFAHVQEERAKNLLKNPALSVSDVGYRLGYAEPAAFTRAFTGWTGMAPSAWRSAAAAGS